ncbi:MAG: hypothetical protein ACI8UD_003965, partial [Planctomycetota bacterium]
NLHWHGVDAMHHAATDRDCWSAHTITSAQRSFTVTRF